MEAVVLKLGYFTWTGTTLDVGHICSSFPWTWLMLCWPAFQFHLALPVLVSTSLPLVMILNKHPACQTPSQCLLLENPANKHSRISRRIPKEWEFLFWGPDSSCKLLICKFSFRLYTPISTWNSADPKRTHNRSLGLVPEKLWFFPLLYNLFNGNAVVFP